MERVEVTEAKIERISGSAQANSQVTIVFSITPTQSNTPDPYALTVAAFDQSLPQTLTIENYHVYTTGDFTLSAHVREHPRNESLDTYSDLIWEGSASNFNIKSNTQEKSVSIGTSDETLEALGFKITLKFAYITDSSLTTADLADQYLAEFRARVTGDTPPIKPHHDLWGLNDFPEKLIDGVLTHTGNDWNYKGGLADCAPLNQSNNHQYSVPPRQYNDDIKAYDSASQSFVRVALDFYRRRKSNNDYPAAQEVKNPANFYIDPQDSSTPNNYTELRALLDEYLAEPTYASDDFPDNFYRRCAQGATGLCAATSLTLYLSHHEPAKYIRLIQSIYERGGFRGRTQYFHVSVGAAAKSVPKPSYKKKGTFRNVAVDYDRTEEFPEVGVNYHIWLFGLATNYFFRNTDGGMNEEGLDGYNRQESALMAYEILGHDELLYIESGYDIPGFNNTSTEGSFEHNDESYGYTLWKLDADGLINFLTTQPPFPYYVKFGTRTDLNDGKIYTDQTLMFNNDVREVMWVESHIHLGEKDYDLFGTNFTNHAILVLDKPEKLDEVLRNSNGDPINYDGTLIGQNEEPKHYYRLKMMTYGEKVTIDGLPPHIAGLFAKTVASL